MTGEPRVAHEASDSQWESSAFQIWWEWLWVEGVGEMDCGVSIKVAGSSGDQTWLPVAGAVSFFGILPTGISDCLCWWEMLLEIWDIRNYTNQSPVAEWWRRWANLGVITTTEWLGGRGFESHSQCEKVRVFHPGKKFQWFSLTENVSYSFSTQQDHLVTYL